jgi:hypothetical protein
VVGARRQRQQYPKNRTILLRRSELTLCAKNGREQMQQRLRTDARLLDHLCSLREYVSRYFEANFLGDLKADDKLKFGWELDW